MLDLFKKTYELIAPVSGNILDLSDVPDGVFAEKLVGDGVAVDFDGDIVVSPADGELSLIFKTCHAFGVTLRNGVELLVHIGIDTVELEGEGFKALARQGQRVKKGDPIVMVDKELVKGRGYCLITPVVITNPDIVSDIRCELGRRVEAGKDLLYTYNIK